MIECQEARHGFIVGSRRAIFPISNRASLFYCEGAQHLRALSPERLQDMSAVDFARFVNGLATAIASYLYQLAINHAFGYQ